MQSKSKFYQQRASIIVDKDVNEFIFRAYELQSRPSTRVAEQRGAKRCFKDAKTSSSNTANDAARAPKHKPSVSDTHVSVYYASKDECARLGSFSTVLRFHL